MLTSKILTSWNLIVLICISSYCTASNKETTNVNDRPCTNHADCAPDECCTFEAVPTFTRSSRIVWKCKPLGSMNELCHSLGSIYCPCQTGLRCMAKAVWFFGSGICG